MINSDPRVLTEWSTEVAGEATVESVPAERESSDVENGLDANDESSVQLPGPVHEIDAPSEPGATNPNPSD